MKDAKGHGSDPKGTSIDEMIAASGEYKGSTLKNDPSYYRGPAHQQGVDDVTRMAQFKAARQKQDQLEAESTRTGKALDSFPKGPMNLTPEGTAFKKAYLKGMKK